MFRYITVFLLLPTTVLGQWKYKSKYSQGFHIDVLGHSRGTSANYNYIPYSGDKGFVSTSIGLAFVMGRQGHIFDQSGVGIPLSVTYNYSLGNLDKRLKNRVTRKCSSLPSKFDLEWFAEAGVGFSPIFYKKLSDERVYSGYLGGRIQMVFARPYKHNDLVVFIRGGYSPFYRTSRGYFQYTPSETGALGGSIGFGI